MALRVKTYSLTPDLTRHDDSELGVGLTKQQIQAWDALGRPRSPSAEDSAWLLLHPRSSDEPRFYRYVVGILSLASQDAGAAVEKVSGAGQIVLTAHRILGFITDGLSQINALSDGSGKLTAFSLDRRDIMHTETPTNWRGSPKRVTLWASATQSPPLDIVVHIEVVVMSIKGTQAQPAGVKGFVKSLNDEELA